MNNDFLWDLLATSSPSGNEIQLQKKVYNYALGYADEVSNDYAGNVYACLNPQNRYTVMLAAHSDEICLRVISIDERGFLKVINTGGVNYNMYLGHQVRIFNGKDSIYGAVVANNNLYSANIKAEELYIDIGAKNKEDAQKYVKHGDWVLFNDSVCQLQNDCIMGKALDDKLGVFVIFEALKKAKELSCQTKVYAVSTTNEETTSKGAYYAAMKVKPDIAIAVDVTFASDFPGSAIGKTGKVVLSGGPVIDNGSTLNRLLNKKIIETAKKYDIDVQYELSNGNTGTDERRIQYADKGIPCALISIPLRNMHSPSEVADLHDLKACIDLIAHFLNEIEYNGLDLNPFNEVF
ncbi:MAG: M20/M25/M40 family metallo-hydrolase [Erysipelotrichia bacterium]|nr:M20/M25/M40 family metallo-hydrolase [Erysipelotrichia bacterium]